MNDLYSPESNIARQRKLDALFADQPYLSATMRASRLHERLDAPTVPCGRQPHVDDPDDLLLRMSAGRAASMYETAEDTWWFASTPSAAREPVRPKPAPVQAVSADAEAASHLTFDVMLDMTAEGPRVAMVKGTASAPDVMTIAEAADYLRISQTTLRKWLHVHAVPHARFGRRLRFRKSALLAWLEGRERVE